MTLADAVSMGGEDGEMNMAEYWFPVNVKSTGEGREVHKKILKGA